MSALCIVCGVGAPAPMICDPCQTHARRDLTAVVAMRTTLGQWEQIDPGSPCRDEPHRLALVDNPLLTSSGGPDLTVIAATDLRSRRIIAGWHDAACAQRDCADAGCTNPDHRENPGDDVVNIDGEILTEARLICEGRSLSALPASIAECLTVIEAGFDWSVRTDRADEFTAVLASCAQALRTVLRDHPERPLGRCPQPDPRGESDACGGPLRWRTPVAWTSGDDLAAIELECARCLDVWGARDLPHLLRVVQPERRFPVSRAWVCREYVLAPATLRQWIRRGHVRTYADESVDLLDVLARVQPDTPSATGA